MDSTQRILVTGTGGFIGFHLARLLLAEGARVQGYDGMTDYYDVALKQRRHAMLLQHEHFTTKEALLEDRETFDALATGPCRSTPPRKRRMRGWPMPMPICGTCRRRCFAFSPFTGLGGAPTLP